MTKREAMDSLTRVKKLLKEIETYHGEIMLKTNFRQRARKDRKKVDDIIPS